MGNTDNGPMCILNVNFALFNKMHAYSKDLCLFYKCIPTTKSEVYAFIPIKNETKHSSILRKIIIDKSKSFTHLVESCCCFCWFFFFPNPNRIIFILFGVRACLCVNVQTIW